MWAAFCFGITCQTKDPISSAHLLLNRKRNSCIRQVFLSFLLQTILKIVKPSDFGKTFDRPMEKDLEEPIELDHLHLILDEGEDGMNPFSFLYLSSEDCLASPASIEADLPPDNLTPGLEPEDKKQATTHINVTSDEVYQSMGEIRQKWLSAGETEIGNLTKPRSDGQTTGALSTITHPRLSNTLNFLQKWVGP